MNLTSICPDLPRPLPAEHVAIGRSLGRSLRGVGRFMRSRKMAYLCLGLLLLAAIAWKVEDWHGEKVWQEVQAEMAARGISLTEIQLPPVAADEENFAMHPVFAPAKESRNGQPITLQNPPQWNFSKLTTRCETASGLAEYVKGINEAAQRPHKQWAPYAVAAGQRDYMLQRPLPALHGLFEFTVGVSKKLSARAQEQLSSHQSAEALATVLALIHTADIISQDDGASMVYGIAQGATQSALAEKALPEILPCLNHSAWREADLQTLAAALGQVDISQVPARSLRREMLFQMKNLLQWIDVGQQPQPDSRSDRFGRALGAGLMKHNIASIYHKYEQSLLQPAERDGRTAPADLSVSQTTTPHNILANTVFPRLGNFIEGPRAAQVLRDKLRLKCLLQRHQLVTGKAAQSLEEIVSPVPLDHNTGDPLTLAAVNELTVIH